MSVKLLPSSQQNFTCTFFKLFHCHFLTNPTNSLCTCSFSGCSSTTNAHSETGQMAVCCQNLTLGALSSRSALSVLVGALFKKFGLFLNTPRTVRRPLAINKTRHSRVSTLLFTDTLCCEHSKLQAFHATDSRYIAVFSSPLI